MHLSNRSPFIKKTLIHAGREETNYFEGVVAAIILVFVRVYGKVSQCS